MICDRVHGIYVRTFPCIFFYFLGDRLERIYSKICLFTLQYPRYPLKPHASIDIFIWQWVEAAIFFSVELRKDQVPHLDSVLAPIKYLRTRPARPIRAQLRRVRRPKIILGPELQYLFFRHLYLVLPDVVSLFVVFIHRHPEVFLVQSELPCQKFPAPRNSFFLKVIAERKIPQHLKKCVVVRGLSDIFKITCAQAFLASGSPSGAFYPA